MDDYPIFFATMKEPSKDNSGDKIHVKNVDGTPLLDKQMSLMDDDNVYMPKADFERLSKYALRKNDILVSVVGTLGNAAIVEDENTPAIFSCKSTVLRTNGISPHYLLAYLNSGYGRSLLIRKERGAVQKGLNLDDLKTLDVYVAGEELQVAVERLYKKSVKIKKCSKSTYTQAETLLLDRLGMAGFSPSTDCINIQSFRNSFAATGRLTVMRSNLLGMIKRVVDAVRNFIGRVTGKPVEEVSDGEVLGLIRSMKDAVEGVEHGYDTAGVTNGVLASRSNFGYPLVSGKSSLEGDIAAAAKKLSASIANGATSDVEIGRTPHVLGFFMESPLTMAMDATVQKKAFLEKHGSEMEGVTPSMLMQAIYRPAMIFKTGENTFNIVTNILTKHGAVLVAIKTNGIHNGKKVAMVTTAFPKERGAFADWIKNGKDSEGTSRTLVYADELQVPEAITGRLNPENTNPAFVGRDFVSALGEIITVEPGARAATSPISD